MSVPHYNERSSATMQTNSRPLPRREPHANIGQTAASYVTPNERPRTRGMGYPPPSATSTTAALPPRRNLGVPTPVFGSRAGR
jgi:hypothetical protein